MGGMTLFKVISRRWGATQRWTEGSPQRRGVKVTLVGKKVEGDSGAEGGLGDVWGDVGEAFSAVGREDYNKASSCTSRSQDSRSVKMTEDFFHFACML